MISGLYLITDNDNDGRLIERVRLALKGGVRILQYRAKSVAPDKQRQTASVLRSLCREASVVFMVNDSPELALACGADGVHLGQGDMPIDQARALLGPGKIIGISTRTAEQALAGEAQGADYIAVGAMFPTRTKSDAQLVGLEALRRIRAAVTRPIVAIGGIDAGNIAQVVDAGADSVALVSAVMEDSSPWLAARELSLAFNRKGPMPRGRVLSIAGSDPGGGAGIQADLKTITLLGGYGMSAITALTAQNTCGVKGIHAVDPAFVAQQIDLVLSDIGADTLKTGMLNSAAVVREVASAIERYAVASIVDPVMIAKGGAALLEPDALEALREELIPRCWLLTPNVPEAQALTGLAVETEADMEQALRTLQKMGARNVLLKGGHLEGRPVDLLLAADTLHRYESERIESRNTHGTGCTLSAAIATFAAQGAPLPQAVTRAKAFIHEAIRTALPLGSGQGPVNHWQAANYQHKSHRTL